MPSGPIEPTWCPVCARRALDAKGSRMQRASDMLAALDEMASMKKTSSGGPNMNYRCDRDHGDLGPLSWRRQTGKVVVK